jgi:protein-tyrosine phosphatase
MSVISRLFGKKRILEPIDLSVLKVDMHSHLIPGIDDGSPDLRTSIEMLQRFESMGYQKVITTPHVMSDYYRNSSDTILHGRDRVREALVKEGINIEFEAAAEYYLDEHFDALIDADDVLTFGKKHVLFELAFMAEPDILKNILFKLQMKGYRPILAHPERYGYWHKELHQFHDLFDRDILLQVNINSLTGTYSPEVQKTAEYLIDNNLVTFMGTDCHHHGHIDLVKQAQKLPHLHKIIESGNLKNNQL